MSIVTITINNKNFQICCNDGQEDLVQKAAGKLSDKIEALKSSNSNASNELLLIMCALGLQDENSSLRKGVAPDSVEEQLSDQLSLIHKHVDGLAKRVAKC